MNKNLSSKQKIVIQAVVLPLVLMLSAVGFWYFNKVGDNQLVGQKKLELREAADDFGKKESSKATDKNQVVGNIKLLFVGDMMFDRYIRQVGERKGYNYIFEGVGSWLKNNDLVIANLEGPITDNKSVSVGTEFGARENYFLTFDPKTAKVLADHNIKLVNIGNNHILNFKSSGVSETEKYLAGENIGYFGNPLKKENYLIKDFAGRKIGLVSYNQFEKDAVGKTLNNIANARKQADVVILYAHWGKEYETGVLPSIRMLAHQFIDAGADLVIGSHPHVVQEKEDYQGKRIYYSLGNFIFDQYFDARTEKGLAVEVEINPATKDMQFKEQSVIMKSNGQTVLGNN